MEGGRSAWIAHIKKVASAKGIKYGEAMKIASKTFKGGQLLGKAGPMGGSRKKHRGGQLYSFAGGPYIDSVLADGAAPTKQLPDATWKGNPAMLSGGRKRRGTKKASRRHRGGNDQLAPPSANGNAAETPYSGKPTSPPDGKGPLPMGGRRRGTRRTRWALF